MKTYMSICKIMKDSSRIWIGMLLTFIICSCHSEDTDTLPLPQLTDEDCKEATAAVFLNGERLADASVFFTKEPESGSFRMELSGVHPADKIELEVATTRSDGGFILFEGEHIVDNLRHMKIDGFYRPYSPLVRVNISYMVPDEITSKTYTIPFEENSGICFQKYSNFETSSEADSLRFICNRINSELSKHLKSIAISFESDGRMTFEYTNSKQEKSKQSFRYWISKQAWSGDNIIHIEQPDLFYNFLLNAMIPDENKTLGNFPYIAKDSTATLFIHEYHNYEFSKSIVLAGDIHQKIYSYLYNFLLTDGTWTDEEKACFRLMVRKTDYFCRALPEVYQAYTWAFVAKRP